MGILTYFETKINKKNGKKNLEFLDFSIDKAVLSTKVIDKQPREIFILRQKTRRKRTSAGTRIARSEGVPGETECVRQVTFQSGGNSNV